jgi:S-adenosylmethionine synthetase
MEGTLTMNNKFLFTSESVTEGHPDKVADQISDTVVDAILRADPSGRVACETMVTTGVAFLGGEITTNTYVDLPSLVRQTIKDIGYTSADYGFDGNTCAIITSIDEQSADIAMGVNPGGAGDQGLMFGYACNETKVLMPLPITMAHRMAQKLAEVRKNGTLPWVRPDGKTQITALYEDNRPVAIDTVVVSTQHDEDVSEKDLHDAIKTHVIEPVLADFGVDHDGYTAHINPTGRFVVGGPLGDCGLTGRKIIVDTYGGSACHGGGAFSGKDSTKVDRSGAYAARHVARNIVAAELADRCQVQVAYAIGVAEPVSISVDSFGTGHFPDADITAAIRKVVDLTPKGIIERLGLRNPIFRATAAYGHFGREDVQFSWELDDLVDQLKSAM